MAETVASRANLTPSSQPVSVQLSSPAPLPAAAPGAEGSLIQSPLGAEPSGSDLSDRIQEGIEGLNSLFNSPKTSNEGRAPAASPDLRA